MEEAGSERGLAPQDPGVCASPAPPLAHPGAAGLGVPPTPSSAPLLPPRPTPPRDFVWGRRRPLPASPRDRRNHFFGGFLLDSTLCETPAKNTGGLQDLAWSCCKAARVAMYFAQSVDPSEQLTL